MSSTTSSTPLVVQHLERRLAVPGRLDVEALALQRVADRVHQRRLVVDDEDARHAETTCAAGSTMSAVVPCPGRGGEHERASPSPRPTRARSRARGRSRQARSGRRGRTARPPGAPPRAPSRGPCRGRGCAPCRSAAPTESVIRPASVYRAAFAAMLVSACSSRPRLASAAAPVGQRTETRTPSAGRRPSATAARTGASGDDLRARRLDAALQPGELEQRGAQSRQPVGLAGDVPEEPVPLGGDVLGPGREHLDAADDRRERRAQLVRRVGDELG